MIRPLSFTDAVRREALAKSRLERVNRKLAALEDGDKSSTKRRELLLKKETLEATLRAIQQMVAAHQARTGEELPYVSHFKFKAVAESKDKVTAELEHLKATATKLPEDSRVVDNADAVLTGVTQDALDAGLLQIQETLSGLLGGKPLVEQPKDVEPVVATKPKAPPVVAPMKKPTVAPEVDTPDLSGLDDLLAECEALP